VSARAEVAAALSRICARCDGPMVISHDAIGRERLRCPVCDGVSRIRHHPDEVLIPQGLVPGRVLPPIRPGQLRCQGCATGVPKNARFCCSCDEDRQRQKNRDRSRRRPRAEGSRAQIVWRPKPCRTCGALFQPAGPNARYCEAHR
jgi:hypothetical protein